MSSRVPSLRVTRPKHPSLAGRRTLSTKLGPQSSELSSAQQHPGIAPKVSASPRLILRTTDAGLCLCHPRCWMRTHLLSRRQGEREEKRRRWILLQLRDIASSAVDCVLASPAWFLLSLDEIPLAPSSALTGQAEQARAPVGHTSSWHVSYVSRMVGSTTGPEWTPHPACLAVPTVYRLPDVDRDGGFQQTRTLDSAASPLGASSPKTRS